MIDKYYLQTPHYSDISSDEVIKFDLEPVIKENYPTIEDLKLHTDEIKKIFSMIKDDRMKYDMRRLLEIELSDVLGIYVSHYKEKTPHLPGYMPSQ